MKCGVCGTESAFVGQFCPRCGAILAEPIRLDDSRLSGAKEDLRNAIRSRKSTDVIIEPLWAVVPLILTFVGAIAGIVLIFSRVQSVASGTTPEEVFSSMRDGFGVIFVASLISVTVQAVITYMLVKRRNDHFAREGHVRVALVKLIKSAAWSPERATKVAPELNTMELEWGMQSRNPLAWSLVVALGAVGAVGLLSLFLVSGGGDWFGAFILAIVLSAAAGFVSFVLIIYMFYWLGKDFREHDTRWNSFTFNARNALSKLGFPQPRSGLGGSQLPDREFALYLILTIFFSPFVYYWWYTLIKDPNDHFRSQWVLEDELLAAIGDRSPPSI